MKILNLRISLLVSLFMLIVASTTFGQGGGDFPSNLSADELSDLLNGDVPMGLFGGSQKDVELKPLEAPVSQRSGDCSDITTIYNTNNGASGNMFNVTNVSGTPIIINYFDGVLESFAPNPATVKVWYREGGYQGFQTNASAWTFLGEDNTVVAQGNDNPTQINVGGLILQPGITYGLFIYDTGSNTDYRNGANTYNNGDLLIQTGLGRGSNNSNPFGGGVFDPRTWNGTIHYCKLDLPAPWIQTSVGTADDCNFAYQNALSGDYGVLSCVNNAFPGTTSDNVSYAHQSVCGDGEITVKVESVSSNGYGGIMIRETTAANAKQVSMFSNLTNVIRWESRAMAGMPKSVQSFYKPSPYWLRLVRQGDWIFGYYSSTGYNFQIVQAVYVPMGYCVEYGMAAFSYVVGETASATFSNVSLIGGGDLQDSEGFLQAPGVESISMDRQQSNLYPNPAYNNITVEFVPSAESSTHLTLRNELGQLIEQRQLEPDAFRTEWAIESLNNGVYFIEINRDGAVPQVLRFVKAN